MTETCQLIDDTGDGQVPCREFVGFARMADGTDLSFLAHEKLAPGSDVTLAAEPDRALVYGDAA